jgi:AraC-like DNA-binding protein
MTASAAAIVPGSYTRLLLRHVGMAAQIPDAISVAEQLAWVASLNRTQPSGWGLDAGVLFDAVAHGPLGTAAVSAPTLERALDVIAHYGRVRSPFLGLSLDRRASGARLRIEHDGVDTAIIAPLLESTVVSLRRLLRVVGGNVPGIRYEFAFARPAHHARYAQDLDGPIAWDAPVTSLTIPTAHLTRSSPLVDARLHRVAIDLLDDAERRLCVAAPAANDVERLLDRLAPRKASLDDVAGAMQVSTRTLSRRLRDAGTSYRTLRDAHRRRRAHRLLLDTDLPAAEIAHRLGYDDPPNFGRACRRWFGCGPSDYRRRTHR